MAAPRLRKFILAGFAAISLLSSVATSFAQVAPPVPALPDTERRTSYVISNSTCVCAIGFQLFGDSTDVGNWIEVFINGAMIPQSGNWTLSSPTGSLATIPRPITNAVLTFTTAQTGTVQIVGARRPRRTSQFNEGAGVPTRSFNVVLSDLTAQNREVWDKINDVTGRSVRTPPGETLALLPVLASRANQGACFDSGGNLVPCVSVPTSTFSAGNGITLTGVNPTTITNNIQAGAGIAFAGTNPIIISSTNPTVPFIQPSDYGAVCDGVTNDTVALQAAITAAAGRELRFPAATCVINAHLNVPANTVISGVSRDLSIIKQIGQDWIFSVTNVSNVTISNLYLLGNRTYTSWTVSRIGAMFLSYNTAQSNLTFRNLKLSNFNATYWIQASQTANLVTNVTFDNLWLNSAVADIPTDPDPFANATHGMAMFSGTAGSRYDNVTIKDWQVDGAGLCIGVILYSNYYKYAVRDSRFNNMGGANTGAFCTNALAAVNVYGVAVYDLNGDGNPPQDGLIVNNYVTAPLAAGIYVVGNSSNYGLLIEGNLITGQISTDGLAVRAGISVSLATGVDIIGNTLINNGRGITVSSQQNGVVSILSNRCTSGGGGSSCLQLTAGAGAANTDRKVVRGNYFESQGTNVAQTSTTGNRHGSIELSGNTLTGVATNVDFGGAFFAGGLTAISNAMSGGTVNFASITGSLTLGFNAGLAFTAATLPTANNGSSVFVSDGAGASSPCTGGSAGATAFRQNSAWKCF